VFDSHEQRQLARAIARKSIVLLKNDGVLPLRKSIKTLAVIGPNADSARNQMADYSYTSMRQMWELKQPENSNFIDLDTETLAPHEVKIITVLDGVHKAVSSDTRVLFAQGCDYFNPDPSGIPNAVEIARQADAVVLVLGDRSGLTPECTTGETRDCAELNLPGIQEDLFRAIRDTGKPIVVVLITGRPYAISQLAEEANAILEAWLPGEEGGSAIADVLFGDENPGGKLPITFPRSAGQLPIFYNSKPSGTKSHWYIDYVNEPVTPLYPFGHGMSYTTFKYADLVISRETATVGESVDISLTVENTGKVAGAEVVQLYTFDEYASTPRPMKELKGYCKIKFAPGEKKSLTFHLPVNQLAFYNNDLNLVLESGAIKVLVGSSSEDIRLTGEFEISGIKKMDVDEPVFVCPVTIK
jgi:beta-glucosidase